MYENGWNKLSHYALASESDLYNVSKYNEVAKLFTMRCCKQMSYNTFIAKWIMCKMGSNNEQRWWRLFILDLTW